eukprot:m.35141 g.35141  ORF g.35141 m.35141 type:complete len:154 (-) comp17091_c0_seq1:286-747(-)
MFVRLLLCAAGFAVSSYAYHVEHQMSLQDDYEAMCDLSATVSCTKVFSSEYGKGFGLIQLVLGDDHFLVQPNSLYGLVFYVAVVVLSFLGDAFFPLVKLAAVVSNIGSIYLGTVLYFVLGDTCIVCISMYIINFLLLLAVFMGGSSASKSKTE